VIEARHARDLAALRCSRGAKRAETAGAALAGAEQAISRARLERARSDAEKHGAELRRSIAAARTTLARANPAAAFSHTLETMGRAEEKAREELAALAAELEAHPAELALIEA
jgi:hypothetical protein